MPCKPAARFGGFFDILICRYFRLWRRLFGLRAAKGRNISVMPLLLIFGFLLLPGAEVYLLFDWFGDAPGWALAYLVLTSAAGVFLMRLARAGFGAILQGWSQRSSPLSFILLGKMWLVGALLLFPGYLTDGIALMVIIIGRFAAPAADNSGAIVQARVIKEEGDERGN
ncbi:MAG: FxsA family protein [Gammaproteobacteria bacterium]